MLTNLILLTATMLTGSPPHYEQIAADYFFETIWTKNYLDYKSIEFNCKTDTAIYVGHVYQCAKWNEIDKKEMLKGVIKEQTLLTCKPSNITIKKRSKSKRLKLRIGARIRLGDTFVVQVDVYKPLEFVNHYFIKLDSKGMIIDLCESSEII